MDKVIHLDEQLHAQFKAWCALKRVRMRDVLEMMIKRQMAAAPSPSPQKEA